MKRAAILIGVDKTGDLPRLKDAALGAGLMRDWAVAQGIDRVTLLTDTQGAKVTLAGIKDAIKALVKAGNVGQLLVYFAGHGVSLQRQEYWLLSDAPDDADEAVNVAGSVALAATCGIGHVVLVSDCCRTAPEGVRAQSVRGGLMFPNLEADERPVDQFFACQLGKPSLEVRDAAITSAEFQALYTHQLVPALMGRAEPVVSWSGDGAARRGHVHLRPLRDHLAAAVAARLEALDLKTKPIQVPVASIASDPPAWISELQGDAAPAVRGGEPAAEAAPPPVLSPQAATTALLREALGGPLPSGAPPPTTRGRPGTTARARPGLRERIGAEVAGRALPFGPGHHETRCGFKLRGALATEAVAADGSRIDFVTDTGPRGSDLRVHSATRPGTSVLIGFERGQGVLLPAIPDFLCALTFDDDDGELLDVAWEPSDNSGWRWDAFRQRAEEIRTLRAIASAAMARGSFKLEGDDALAVAQRMQLGKGLDPGLGLYAAYSYHELQRRTLIRDMAGTMAGDLGAPLFDVALLARALNGRTLGRDAPPTLGALPLLAQGWALLRAFEITLPATLAPLMEQRLPSLWTMFDARGTRRLRELIGKGALK